MKASEGGMSVENLVSDAGRVSEYASKTTGKIRAVESCDDDEAKNHSVRHQSDDSANNVGGLEKRSEVTAEFGSRRCKCEHCESPTNTAFLEVEADRERLGGDLNNLAGRVLCQTCYYRCLARDARRSTGLQPHSSWPEQRCTFLGCKDPKNSGKYFPIEKGLTAGGQNWGPLIGSILCNTCFARYMREGSLEGKKSGKAQGTPVTPLQKYCTNAGCDRPDRSTRFHRIEEGQTAGGRNWSVLAGSMLCHACYCQYLKKGTLERTKNKPIAAARRRCTVDGCDRPDYGTAFYQIEVGKNAGGWDWSSLTGNVLCSACYQRFLRSGTTKGVVRPVPRQEEDLLTSTPTLLPYKVVLASGSERVSPGVNLSSIHGMQQVLWPGQSQATLPNRLWEPHNSLAACPRPIALWTTAGGYKLELPPIQIPGAKQAEQLDGGGGEGTVKRQKTGRLLGKEESTKGGMGALEMLCAVAVEVSMI